jgi:hypothetical protein
MPSGMGACESPPSTSAMRVRPDFIPDFHQRMFARPARSVRSSQSVDCLAASCAAGQGPARPPAPSVLVVPPDFDGLLRASPCGLVASRSRPWGSSRFQTPATDREWDMGISHATRGASARDPFPGTHDPSKPFPCTQPSEQLEVTEATPHLSLTPASPTSLLPPKNSIARGHQSSHPGRSRSGFPSRRCRFASAPPPSSTPSALSGDSFERPSRATWSRPRQRRLAQPLDLRVFRLVQIRCTGPTFPSCLCPMLPWALCSAHRVLEDSISSEEAPSEEGESRPAAAVLLRRQRRRRSHPGPT